jgi:hypothetical protein
MFSDYVARYTAVRIDLSSPNGSTLFRRRTKQWSRVEHGPGGPRAKEGQGRSAGAGSDIWFSRCHASTVHWKPAGSAAIACQCVDTPPCRLQLCHCMWKSLSCISDLNRHPTQSPTATAQLHPGKDLCCHASTHDANRHHINQPTNIRWTFETARQRS